MLISSDISIFGFCIAYKNTSDKKVPSVSSSANAITLEIKHRTISHNSGIIDTWSI